MRTGLLPTGRAGLHGRDTRARSGERRGRAVDPMLACLRAADLVLRIAAKTGGPRSPGSSLAERNGSGFELTDDQIIAAQNTIAVVKLIENPIARRVLDLSIETHRGRPVYTIRDIAKKCGLTHPTAHRHLHRALGEVWRHLSIEPMKDAA